LLQSVLEADLARARALVQGTTGKDARSTCTALEAGATVQAQSILLLTKGFCLLNQQGYIQLNRQN
jgi:hypothetical protein